MADKKRKSRAEIVREEFLRLSGQWYRKWREKEQQSYDFATDSQLTDEELEELHDYNMPDFTINRIMPIVEIVKYFATSNNPRWQAVGADGSDSDMAHVHATIAEYDWYNSNGRAVFSDVITNALTKSLGYFFVDVDPDAAQGTGEVRFSSIETWDVYVDPASRDILFRDAGVIMIKKDFPRSQLINKLPQYKAKILKAAGEQDANNFTARDVWNSNTIQWEDIQSTLEPVDDVPDDLLPYYEVYRKKKVPYYHVYIATPPSEQEVKQMQKQVEVSVAEFQREQEVSIIELQLTLDEQVAQGEMIPERRDLELEKATKAAQQAIADYQRRLTSELRDEITKIENFSITEKEFNVLSETQAFKDDVVSFYKYFETRVEKECVVGDQLLYSELEEYSEYRIVPVPFYWTGTVYPMSFVLPLVGKQREINKSHQIMIHHANLSSNLRWMAVEGEITDEADWVMNSTTPSGIMKYNPGVSASGPREIMPQPINNAFYTITKEGESDLEYLAGIQPSVMGITKDQPETYRGLLASDEYGTRRIRQWINNILEPALEHLGKVHAMVATKTYDINKVFRVVQPNIEEGEGAPKTAEVNIPMYDDYGEVIGKYNDYQAWKADIRFVAGSTQPLNRWALLAEYKELFQLGIVDDIEVREHTDVRNKEALNERFSRMAQLNSALEARDEEIKSLKGDIETLRRGILMQSLRADKEAMKSEERDSIRKTKAEEEIKRGKLKNDLTLAEEKIKLEKEKVKLAAKGSEKK